MFTFVHVYKVTHHTANSELGNKFHPYVRSSMVIVKLVKDTLTIMQPAWPFICSQNPVTFPYLESHAFSSLPRTQYL